MHEIEANTKLLCSYEHKDSNFPTNTNNFPRKSYWNIALFHKTFQKRARIKMKFLNMIN